MLPYAAGIYDPSRQRRCRGGLRAAHHPARGASGRTVEGPLSTQTPVQSHDSPLATRLAEWVSTLRFEDLPDDVVATTKLRILDVIGLALAGSETPFGRSTRAAVLALSPQGTSRILGTGERVAPVSAAFANASFAQALEFDDTHNESIVHMSSPAVAAALALSESRRISGRDAIVAIALANEISSRVGSVSPGQFHRRGFHPTGLFAPFGITYLAGKLLGSDAKAMTSGAGICGSVASGLLECWVDGTQSKFLHSGFAAQSGIAAATLAHAGVTGPATILEGRFGLFASHLQHPDIRKNLHRVTGGLGMTWESRNASFKPYPAAHVLHPYVDALLRAREQHGITPADVAHIECPVAEFNVSIVCEPIAEKLAPATDSHARISLQYTMAEALHEGRLGKTAYSAQNLRNPDILRLAQRVRYYVDPELPGPGRFKGAVQITLHDGRVISETQEHNLGSPENPMNADQLRAKFDENAGGILSPSERTRLAQEIDRIEDQDDASAIIEWSMPLMRRM